MLDALLDTLGTMFGIAALFGLILLLMVIGALAGLAVARTVIWIAEGVGLA